MDCYLYGLVDPRDGKLRYIGKTTVGLNGVRKRWYAHQGDAATGVNTHKAHWIRTLTAVGLKPELVVISNGNWSAEEVCRREIETIAYARARGVDLTNTTDGGDGMLGIKLTAEQTAQRVARLVAANTGRKRPEETRQRMRDAWEHRDREVSEEVRAKHRANWADGKSPLTEEGRARIAASSKRPKTEATKQKMREAHKRRVELLNQQKEEKNG